MIHTHSTGTPEKMPFSEALTIPQQPILNTRKKLCELLKLRKTVGKEGTNILQKAVVLILNQQQQ